MKLANTLILSLIFVGACGGSDTPFSSSSSSSASAPVAAFTFSPSSPAASTLVQFTDTSTGTPGSWAWTFGDGGTSTEQNPTHTYDSAGTFTATLTASNSKGSSVKSQAVTVIGRTVGLMINTGRVYDGYLLFAPKQNTMTYLINNDGRIVHQWTASKNPPGQSVYLLENGHLLRACMTKGALSSGGGEGGRVEEYDWDDNLVWALDYSTDSYMQHHDIHVLPNGNILMLVVEKKTYAEVLAAGFNPGKLQPEIQQKGVMLPDSVVEIQPTRPVGGNVVWEWHVWDHLIQDYDKTKANYGVVAAHPELISTAGDQKTLPAFWNHMNSIDYNADFDQIALSVRGNSEVWIIDHSTTTTQAGGHTDGKRGKGGDLLYRWGNPIAYGAGTAADERYFQQHDVEWIPSGYPGAGDLTCFNNGLGRGDYSTVDEFTPVVTANGDYPVVAGSALGPKEFAWTYRGTTAQPMYSENISGAHRLPDGHTIICSGGTGQLLEVTMGGDVVWKYICPVDQNGRMKQGSTPAADPNRAGETMNEIFRVYKYPTSYKAFDGRTLTPGDYVELY
jgi:PKD repeat protein